MPADIIQYWIDGALIATGPRGNCSYQTLYFCSATGRPWAAFLCEGLPYRAQSSTAPDYTSHINAHWPPGALTMGIIPSEWPLPVLSYHIAALANSLLKGTTYHDSPPTFWLQHAPNGAFGQWEDPRDRHPR